ncbi:MAG: hypothetical protein JNM91_00655 [Flavobacteriales bacterium]|nr:hypothetical protein [Flavobacteriales bacterium]
MRTWITMAFIGAVSTAHAYDHQWTFEASDGGLDGWRLVNGTAPAMGTGHLSATALNLSAPAGPQNRVTVYRPIPYIAGHRYGLIAWSKGSITSQTNHQLALAWIDTLSGAVNPIFPSMVQSAPVGSWRSIEGLPTVPFVVSGQGLALCVTFTVEALNADDECWLDHVAVQTYPSSTMVLQAAVLLGGPYDAVNMSMTDGLRASGLIPQVEPYTALGYMQVGGGGGETLPAVLLGGTEFRRAVDWIRLEVRSATNPSVVLATRQCVLDQFGQLHGRYGELVFDVGVPAGSYRIAVRHRNHSGCMTANTVVLSTTGYPVLVDLNSEFTATYGTNARRTIGTKQVLWPGRVTGDGTIKYVGADNDRDPILTAVGGTTPNVALTNQYRVEDVNLDGSVKYTGINNDRDPVLINVGSTTPNNTRQEQLP